MHELSIECVEYGNTLVSKILANSLNNRFSQRGSDELHKSLNGLATFEGYPIAEQFQRARD